MRLRFLIRYAVRSVARFTVVLLTRSTEALTQGVTSFKMILQTGIALLLAYLLILSYPMSINVALRYVERERGIAYTPITRDLLVNALMPTLWTITLFFAAVYMFRYIYDAELSHAYAGISLSIVSLLIGILTGHDLPVPTLILILIMLSLISSVHTYYYSVNMLEPYAMRLKRIRSVLDGHTHVPISRLKAYIKEMRSKDRRFRSRLTLEDEIRKIGRVAVAAMLGSIVSIAFAIALAYTTRFIAQLAFTNSVYEAIANSVEASQPELYIVFVTRFSSLLYVLSLKYSGILKEE